MVSRRQCFNIWSCNSSLFAWWIYNVRCSTPFKHEISLKYNNKLLSSTKLDFSFFFLLLYNLDPDKLRQADFNHCWKIMGICIDWSWNLIWGDIHDPTSFKSFKNYNNNNIINFVILNRCDYIILLSPPPPPPPKKKLSCLNKDYVCMYVYVVVQFHPWFKILCPFVLQLIIIHYHTPKQRGIELKPRIKLNRGN